MGIAMPPKDLLRYREQKDAITDKLELVNLKPNNTQYACAVACVCDPKRARTFLAVPSGQGKSRIIATIIALVNEFEGSLQFAIVFPNELLASVNAEDYK